MKLTAHIRRICHHRVVLRGQQLGLLHQWCQTLECIRYKQVLAGRLAQLLQPRQLCRQSLRHLDQRAKGRGVLKQPLQF